MRYSTELRDRINVKRYGFLSFAKSKIVVVSILKNLLIVLKHLQQMQ